MKFFRFFKLKTNFSKKSPRKSAKKIVRHTENGLYYGTAIIWRIAYLMKFSVAKLFGCKIINPKVG